jgi:hypothetical protein
VPSDVVQLSLDFYSGNVERLLRCASEHDQLHALGRVAQTEEITDVGRLSAGWPSIEDQNIAGLHAHRLCRTAGQNVRHNHAIVAREPKTGSHRGRNCLQVDTHFLTPQLSVLL